MAVLSLLVVLLMAPLCAVGQTEPLPARSVYKKINRFDNASSRLFYTAQDDTLYTFRQMALTSLIRPSAMAVNPAGSSVAILSKKGSVGFWSSIAKNRTVGKFKFDRKTRLPTAICYSPDALYFLVASSDCAIRVFCTHGISTKKKKNEGPKSVFKIGGVAQQMVVSSNNYFVASVVDNRVEVTNFETGQNARMLEVGASITGIAFSPDATQLAVATDSTLRIYSTRNWSIEQTYADLEHVAMPIYNYDGKYLSLVQKSTNVLIFNLKSQKVIEQLPQNAPIVATRFIYSPSIDAAYLVVALNDGFTFYNTSKLDPLYGKILDTRVNELMRDWSRMIEGESMEDYRIRMSDENRTKQHQLFAQNTATELAGDRVSMATPFVGEYDTSAGLLGIFLTGLGSIALPVPAEEADELDSGKMKFSNAVYTLGADDQFTLVYVEVTNETTGKTYVYDNIVRTKMAEMETDMNFVSLEVIEQVHQEELELQAVKEKVVEQNKLDHLITDKTQINVRSEVVPDVDADGKKILNYKLVYQYEVEQAFLATEDFPSGGYDIEKSPAAMAMIKIIKQSLEGEMIKHLKPGKKVRITITGVADASPIRGKLSYTGKYGEFEEVPYYMNGELDNITVTKAQGIVSNPQLAFVRALGVRYAIEKNVAALGATQNEFQMVVNVAKKMGGEHCRIMVDFVIVDAFPVK